MHEPGSIVQPLQEAYLDRLLPPRDPLLAEMEALAAERDVPISSPAVGRLLTTLARATGARRIVEIGTAIGYGAICLARGSDEAVVQTIDPDRERLEQARAYLERAGVLDRVELLEAAALDVLPTLDGPIDLVYGDAVKSEYRRYLDLLLPKVRVGGLLVFDNLLWKGMVATDPEAEEDPEVDEQDEAVADAMRSFNGYLMIHPQLSSVVLPLGDGVGVATKLKPLITELGGPF